MSKTPSPGGLGAARIVRNGLGHTRGMGTGLLGDSGARNPPTAYLCGARASIYQAG